MNNRRLFPAVLVLLSIVIFTVSCTGSTLFATKSWSEVNEIGENICILITESKNNLNQFTKYNIIFKFLENINDYKKETLGLSNKIKFKCMDVLDILE